MNPTRAPGSLRVGCKHGSRSRDRRPDTVRLAEVCELWCPPQSKVAPECFYMPQDPVPVRS